MLRRVLGLFNMKVLIVEDDSAIAGFVKKGFEEAGFLTDVVSDGKEALSVATSENFDLLIVDVMLPGLDGLSLVEELRKRGRQMPVVFLSAKRSIEERIEGLQRGGDDYLTKPFSFSELLARSLAILRRTKNQTEFTALKYADLELDMLQRTVKRGGHLIELQQKEFVLLEYLVRNQGHVLSKTQILEKVWSYNFDPQTNVVDVLVCRLRNKLERDNPAKLIKTIRGVGYVLRND